MHRDYPGVYIAPMAKKGGKQNKFDSSFLKKRMFYMQEFMNSLCEHHELRASPHLIAFLQIPETDKFEKARKDLDKEKSTNPNSILESGGVNRKHFYQKSPIRVENVSSISGTVDCKINSDLRNYCTALHAVIKDTVPNYAKYCLSNQGVKI